MRPTAIMLNYSVENIQNNVCQKIIIIIIYEKFQFDSLVWSSLTLTPMKYLNRHKFGVTAIVRPDLLNVLLVELARSQSRPM